MKEVVIELRVEGVDEATQSIGELEQSIQGVTQAANSTKIKVGDNIPKDVKDASDSVDNFEKKLVSTRDVMKSSQATARLLSGSIQLASSSFAAFGADAKEVEKALLQVQVASQFAGGIRDLARGLGGLSKSFDVLGVAMKAVPFIAIATAVIALVSVFVDWDEVLQGLTDTFGFIIEPVKEFFTTVDEGKIAVENVNLSLAEYEKLLNEIGIASQERQLDIEFEIAALKLLGGTEEQIATKRRQLIRTAQADVEREIDAVKNLIFELKTKGATQEQIDKAQSEKDKLNLEARRLEVDLIKFDASEKQKAAEKDKQNTENYKKLKREELEALKEAEEAKILLTEKGSFDRLQAELNAINTIQQFQINFANTLGISENGITIIKQKNIDERKKLEDEYYKFVSDLKKLDIEEITIGGLVKKKATEDDLALQKLAGEQVLALDKFIRLEKGNSIKLNSQELAESLKAVFALATELNTALSGLNDVYFQNRLAKVKGNQVEEEKIAKKQFQVNKALQLSTAIITGIGATLEAYKNGMKNPVPLLGPATAGVYAAIAASVSAINIAKIASTKFQPSGGSSGSAPTAPSTPSLNTAGGLQPTSFAPATFGSGISQSQTFGAQQGSGGNVLRAYVSETDLTETQRRLRNIRSAGQL